MKILLRKIVHLCGGLMPDEIYHKPVKRLRVSFEHFAGASPRYINDCATRLIGECVLDEHLGKHDLTVDCLTGKIKECYEFYVVDLNA